MLSVSMGLAFQGKIKTLDQWENKITLVKRYKLCVGLQKIHFYWGCWNKVYGKVVFELNLMRWTRRSLILEQWVGMGGHGRAKAERAGISWQIHELICIWVMVFWNSDMETFSCFRINEIALDGRSLHFAFQPWENIELDAFEIFIKVMEIAKN